MKERASKYSITVIGWLKKLTSVSIFIVNFQEDSKHIKNKKKIVTKFFSQTLFDNYLAYVLDGAIRTLRLCSKIGGLPSLGRSQEITDFLLNFKCRFKFS